MTRLGSPVSVLLCLLLLGTALAPGRVTAQTPPKAPPPIQPGQKQRAEALEHFRRGEFALAIPKAREALALREKALGPNHLAVAESLQTLADCLRETGAFAEARPLYERALAIREKALGPEHANVAWTLDELGVLLTRAGDHAAARPPLQRALAIREKVFGPDHNNVAASLQNLGFLLYLEGDFAAARPLLERALKIRETAPGTSPVSLAATALYLGRLYRDSGDYAAARPLLERSLQIREQALGPDHPSVATSALHLGNFFAQTGDYAAARPLLERALAIREKTMGPDHLDVAASLSALGRLLSITGDLAGARRAYERAIRVDENALGPDHILLAEPLNYLGALLRQMGDYAGARAALERALAIRERVLGPDHPGVAASLGELGLVLHRTRSNDAARAAFQRALRIRERAFGPTHLAVARSLSALAQVDRATGRYAESRQGYEKALKIREQILGPQAPDIGWSLNDLGAVLRVSGDYDAALPVYERALPIARSAALPDLTWRVTFGLGRTYEQRGRLEEALALYRESVSTMENLAGQFRDDALRAQFLSADNRLLPYDALTRLLLELHGRDAKKGYDREAWALLETRKGRVVADALASARPAVKDSAARQAAEQVQAKGLRTRALERALREAQEASVGSQGVKQVESLTSLLAQTKAEYLTQAQAFVARYPQYKTQFYDQQTVDPKTLAKFADRLPEGTLAIQYFAAPETLYLFVVAPGGSFQVRSRAIAQKDLYQLVKEYRRHIDAATTQYLPWIDDGSALYREKVAPLREVSQKLSALLLEPVAPELATHRNLVLFPNDILLSLPIHALTRRDRDGSVRFLAETHVVSYVTQLELVDLLTPSRPAANLPLLALANPDGSLPAASREIHELAKIRAKSTTLEGTQATKERFVSLASKFSDVHLATHGVFDTERPERSYLLMAGKDEASQRLTFAEIAGLSLGKNGMAVLSACETALNEQVPGAALSTLSYAFSQAGAQSIVASLWKVNDETTRYFMVAFHRALATSGRAAALQQAQLTILRNQKTAHPYYWAPFILIGGR